MPCQCVKHLACSSSPGVSNMKFREIKEKYRRKAKLSGSLILLNENDDLSFIDECSTLGLKLLGVEGFLITDTGAFQPDQSASNDIADTPMPNDDFIKMTKHLIMKNRYHWFEVVYGETNG